MNAHGWVSSRTVEVGRCTRVWALRGTRHRVPRSLFGRHYRNLGDIIDATVIGAVRNFSVPQDGRDRDRRGQESLRSAGTVQSTGIRRKSKNGWVSPSLMASCTCR